MDGDGVFHLAAEGAGMAISLRLNSSKPPAFHGANGISKKASAPGHASHYYSLTRLASDGEVRIGDKLFQVSGQSWFDHEWATNALAPGQVGWDWLSLQLDDGSELMLYQMRLENGTADPTSSGTLVAADGVTTHLPSTAFRMTPVAHWKSKLTNAQYPIEWRVELPEKGIRLNVRAVLENQELALKPLIYWEGAMDVTGTRDGKPIKGAGYLELTGYAGPLRELQR